ncbi:hypothetical protein DEH84_15905 [Aquabacterium olei]|uniref:Type II secretion system protein GspC N-terminal domain-containing protein n=1 Tax=Aquabacterium olei TaxID=1296669 RepID=A0A2U8FWX7_9BURK|nr:hypothetical protein [Aquabacterium olei]AWI54736.1 hypothetical protein DEH84_15905 [Aquabacterium olei]
MASRFFALLTWAAVAASLAFWGLRWLAPPTGVPANASPVSLDSAARGDLRRLLAGPAKATEATPVVNASAELLARIKVLGVVAPRTPGGRGVALVSVDGKPPRALRQGDRVDGDLVVKALTQRGVDIGPAQGDGVITLDLPLLPAPAAGSLPPVSGFSREGARPANPIDGPPAARGTLASPEQQMQGNAMPPPPVPANPPPAQRGQPGADSAV